MSRKWPHSSLKEVLATVIDYRGRAPPKRNSGITLITARNVRPGQLDFSHKEFVGENEYDSWMNRGIPTKGDILFTTEAPLGNVCMFPATGKYALGQRIVTLRPKRGVMDCDFLCQYLLSDEGQEQIAVRSTGSTAKGIKSSELMKISIPTPPLSEQRKIAQILQTWDLAIAKVGTLCIVKERRFKAVAQMLFAPSRAIGRNIRRSNWSATTFGKVFVERQDRNSKLGPDDVVTVGKYAIRKQTEHFKRSVASKDLSNYWVISPGEFVYDPMSAYYGALGRYDGSQDGIVSPAYRVNRLVANVNRDFMVHLLRSHHIRFLLEARSSQGNKEGKRRLLQRDEFDSIEFKLPPMEVQKEIASILSDFKVDVDATSRQLEALSRQKRGLMQKLLNGEWRVKNADKKVAA